MLAFFGHAILGDEPGRYCLVMIRLALILKEEPYEDYL
jgi:hypothetical protein